MFRAAVLSLALTLIGGVNTALLCQAWCEPQAAAEAGCHQHGADPSASVTAAEDCGDAGLDVVALVRGDDGRGPLTPDTTLAADFAGRSVPVASHLRFGHEPHTVVALGSSPRFTPLRL